MTLEALADRTAGLLLVGFDGTAVAGATAQFIAGTAGAILFRRNIADAGQARELIAGLAPSSSGNAPLLIAVDQEGGPVERLGAAGTPPPAAMALGSADDPVLTRSVYAMIGDEMRGLGLNLDLAPVADVLADVRSPLGLRSFGADPQAVARHVSAAVQGLHDAGVLATAKHFPGLGRAIGDSHVELPSVNRSAAELRDFELLPFRAAIDAGVDVMMTAHLALPRIDAGGEPATLSRGVVTGLLRDELGFDGVICTDDLEMQAIAARAPLPEAAVEAIAAGVDLLLFSRSLDAARVAQEALRRALLDGRLDPGAVEASLARIERARRRAGAVRDSRKSGSASARTDGDTRAAHAALVRDAARRSIAVLRASADALPLRITPGMRIFVVNFIEGGAKPASAARVHSAVGRALAAAGANVTEQLRDLEPAGHEFKQLLMAAGSAQALIAVTRRAFAHPLQAQAVSDLALFGKPLAAIAALEPFDGSVVPEQCAVIASFGDGDAQLEAAADVLLGKTEAPGRAPIGALGVVPAAGAP